MRYDFIIVGAGPSGSALAGRLSKQQPLAKILLIESGGDNSASCLKWPVFTALSIPFSSSVNYGYKTAPQYYLNKRKCYFPQGRGLGGGSTINAMVYIRGHQEDYDRWARNGCNGWSWADVLPYFIRSENNTKWNNELHGNDGPSFISDLKSVNPASIRFINAAKQAGHRLTADFNGGEQEGVGLYQVFQKNGERYTTYNAYKDFFNAKNITVLIKSTAQKLILKEGTAIGIVVKTGALIQDFYADKEIILCAGAIGTPHLLMCSGIGPADVLRTANIPMLYESSHVGKNLQDHIDYVRCAQVPTTDLLGISFKGLNRFCHELNAYRFDRTGMLSSNGAEAGGFFKTDTKLAQPDIQMHFVIAMMDNHGRSPHYGHGYSCHTCLLQPLSRGSVTVNSMTVSSPPIINPQYLSNSHDIERLIRGVHIMNNILSQQAILNIKGKSLSKLPKNDAEWENELRGKVQTSYHPVGTCAMGTVVTPTLKFIGIRGLRIADASIMPTIISGNTQAACVMIGEKVADLIINEYFLQ